jgi:N-acetylglucosamine-6-phosphate deacetylase
VTLPLLEGVRRMASWGAAPERAIAAATVLPRQVLGDGRSVEEMLVGTPLSETLRWSLGAEGLRWDRPA